MDSLFLAWQAQDASRAWYPIGRLDADLARNHFAFRYTQGALRARKSAGFKPLVAFPVFDRTYESAELFPVFSNRVVDSHRKDFAAYLESLALSPEACDPIEILAITGGERQTDNLEVFPKIEKQPDGSFSCRFFLHGWRHLSEQAKQRLVELRAQESLGVSVEITNPKTSVAIQLTTQDYGFLGWAPRYLVGDLLKAMSERPQVSATVIRVNNPNIPANRRVLIEITGRLPEAYEPMSGTDFQVVDSTQH